MTKKTYFSFSSLLFIAFVILAFSASVIPFFKIDLSISQHLQSLKNPVLDLLMRGISSVGGGRVMPFAVAGLVVFISLMNLRLEAIYLALSTLASFISGVFVKWLVHRPRPDEQLVGIYKHLTDSSFPSSHVLTYTTVFGFLFFLGLVHFKASLTRDILLFVSAFLVLTVGISRIYLGAHWASDVLGGYLLGGFCLNLTINTYKAHVKR